MAQGRSHSSFFRLIHRLGAVPRFEHPPGVALAQISPEQAGEIAALINRCYRHSGIVGFSRAPDTVANPAKPPMVSSVRAVSGRDESRPPEADCAVCPI